MNQTLRAFLLMTTAALLGMWIAIVVKILSAHVSSFVILFLTRVCLLLGLIPLIAMHGRSILSSKRPVLIWVMAFCYVIAFILYFEAIALVPLSFASLFFNSAPLYVPLLAYFVLSDPSIKYKGFWLGLSIAFVGVVLILLPTGNVQYSFVGLLLAFVSGMLLAVSQVIAKVLMKIEPPQRVVCMQVIASIVLSAIPAAIVVSQHSEHYLTQLLNLETILLLVTAGLCSWFYQLLRAKAIKMASVSVVMPFGYLGVVFVGVADFLMWHVMPDWVGIVGIVLVISGVVVLLNVRR